MNVEKLRKKRTGLAVDMQQGSRNGDMAQLMKPAVERLTEDDIIAIVAYVASLEP